MLMTWPAAIRSSKWLGHVKRKTNMNELYKPTIVNSTERLVLLGFSLKECPLCKRPMVYAPADSLKRCGSRWGAYHDGGNTIEAQCKRGGIVLKSGATDKNNDAICEECAAAGASSFVCSHCKKEQKTDQIEESFGYPPEFLCKPCYSTVPAAEWNALVKKLYEAHRYDFE